MLFALALERDPVSTADVPGWVISFLQDAGGFAAFGLAIWILAYLIRRLAAPGRSPQAAPFDPFGGFVRLYPAGPGAPAVSGLDRVLAESAPWLRRLFVAATVGAALVYGVVGLTLLPDFLGQAYAFFGGEGYTPAPPSPVVQAIMGGGFTIGGALALFAVLLPFAVDLLRLRPRRIIALVRLTILEVSRRRVLWVFLLLSLVFLFGQWFIDSKPENQVRSYVEVVYLAMAVLILITGSLVSSFGIPTDVRQQTVHTVLTKPVERYEIFLGRFAGYVLVMTAVLAVMTAFSLLYVLRGVSPEAQTESLKARVPVYGTLQFEGTESPDKATNVGDEWDYRQYIGYNMPSQPPQYAVWSIPNLPADLNGRAKVPCEFTFQIYRTTTGEINKGVFCSFAAESWLWDPSRRPEFDAERKRLRDEQRRGGGPANEDEIDDKLAEKFGYYELPSKEVTNYHTQALELPGGLFRNYFRPREELVHELEALQARQQKGGLSHAEEERVALLERGLHGARPPLHVRVRCISRTQFVGMAKYDLYLLDHDGGRPAFMANFFKGAAGIWFWLVLVIGVALACSTYLSGVISWICTLFLFVVGLFREHAVQVALGQNQGGGPAESLLRLFGRQNLATPLEGGTVSTVATHSDEVWRWFMRRFIDVLPDVDRYDFSSFVANGFNVAGSTLGLTLLFLAGYLLLWAVLGYYLIKSREIAGPT